MTLAGKIVVFSITAVGALAIGAFLLLIGLGYLLGESSSVEQLYNPVTHEQASCGRGMHRGSSSDEELAQRERCIQSCRAHGFRVITREDNEALHNEFLHPGSLKPAPQFRVCGEQWKD